MSIAVQSMVANTERSDFAAVELARISVGAGALDSPFGELRGLIFRNVV